MSLAARALAVFMALMFLAGTHWRAYSTGKAHQRNAHAAQQLQATQAAASAAIQTANTTIEATHDRAQKQTRITADSRSADADINRLRQQLAAARAAAAAASSAGACTPDTPAQDQLLAAMAADIAHLAEQGAATATAADGHAADALMLQGVCQRPTHSLTSP